MKFRGTDTHLCIVPLKFSFKPMLGAGRDGWKKKHDEKCIVSVKKWMASACFINKMGILVGAKSTKSGLTRGNVMTHHDINATT